MPRAEAGSGSTGRKDASIAKKYDNTPIAPEEAPTDLWSIFATFGSIFGLFMRNKLFLWLSLFALAYSFVQGSQHWDGKQSLMTLVFVVMGLVTNYLGPGPIAQ